jgi:hypothetical protein
MKRRTYPSDLSDKEANPMKLLSSLVIVAVATVLSAGAALAAGGPNDPFAQADATVAMCSGIFPLVALALLVGFMITVLVKRGQDNRNR